MHPTLIFNGCLVATLVAHGMIGGINTANAAPQTQVDLDEQAQVLTRGPVHEAFVETISFDPDAGIIVPQRPPEAIEELPPEQRPAGDNVAWIPGYSAWDDEREDFLWVSGIWRDLPPGRQWMPGYWTESEFGYQWISGYWADATQTEIQYLPEPPATAEVGPNISAPSNDYTWLPGCWIWQQNRYAWRPGHWAQMQSNWDWVPAHYVCSPRGYIFVNGYYDHSVARRGVLFAPVYFDRGIYSRRGYSYSPSTVINLSLFAAHLFSRPRYNHYYFGDYYAANYNDAGYYPWYSYSSRGDGYDPFYARQRWDNRQDSNWQHRIESDFAHRRNHEDARPPRTLAALVQQNKSGSQTSDKSLVVAMPLEQLTQNQNSQQRFQLMDQGERQALTQRRQDVQKFRNERQKLEAKTTVTRAHNPTETIDPVNVRLPKSPVVSKNAETPGKGVAAPKAQIAPKVDLNVEPGRRVTRKSRPNARNGTVSQKIPGKDTRPPSLKETPGAEPKGGKKGESNSGRDKSNPKPDVPKADPKPEVSRAEPKPESPKVKPTKPSKPDVPKADPKPEVPRVEPKPESPRVKPTKPPKPDVPKADPKPEVPRVEPKPESPRLKPTKPPKPDIPKADPKPEVPKVEPKPESPKVKPGKP